MPRDAHIDSVRELTTQIRKLFHLLGVWGNAIHEGTGLNSSLRAVMEFLSVEGPATVPDIARAKRVTRQFIQSLVDQLLELEFVEAVSNPRHRRSSLIALTEKGANQFAELIDREEPLWAELAASVARSDAEIAMAALTAMREYLEAVVEGKEHSND